MDDYQTAPIEEGSEDATNEEGVQGILEQLRADLDLGHTHESVLMLLHERFTQANIEVSAEREEQLAEELLRSRPLSE